MRRASLRVQAHSGRGLHSISLMNTFPALVLAFANWQAASDASVTSWSWCHIKSGSEARESTKNLADQERSPKGGRTLAAGIQFDVNAETSGFKSRCYRLGNDAAMCVERQHAEGPQPVAVIQFGGEVWRQTMLGRLRAGLVGSNPTTTIHFMATDSSILSLYVAKYSNRLGHAILRRALPPLAALAVAIGDDGGSKPGKS